MKKYSLLFLIFIFGFLVACSNKYYKKVEKKNIVFKTEIVENYYGILTNEQKGYIVDDNNIIIAEMQLKSIDETNSDTCNIDYCIFEHPDYQGKSFIIGNILNKNVFYLDFSDNNIIEVNSFENTKFFFKIVDSTDLIKKYNLYDKMGKSI